MQPCYHTRPRSTNRKQQPASIPGGAYAISPLAAASIWAALKLKLIAWHHLRIWIALHEIRTWRDTTNPAHRNLFRFTPRRIAQVLGNRNAGPRLKSALADLERLGLARLTPTELSFTGSLGNLPPELQAETDRILKTLGNHSTTRAVRMPRRLMRHIMRSRPRPLRAAVIFGMLLRIMPVKRYGWYKGCMTAVLLVRASGFNECRIKHERAALIEEGFFERLETPDRVRKQHGDWYALAHNLPITPDLETRANRQPPRPLTYGNPQPPIRKPVPSFGMKTNQYLRPRHGAVRSPCSPEPAVASNWHHMTPEDLREPCRRAALHQDACSKGLIGDSPAERLMFYAAIARARRLATLNPCGMLRRIVQTPAYHGYIADCDEDQARAWLALDRPRNPDTIDARDFLHSIVGTRPDHNQTWDTEAGEIRQSAYKEHHPLAHVEDSQLASYLIRRLQQAGFPTANAFELIMTTHEGRKYLAGWNHTRWNRAVQMGFA